MIKARRNDTSSNVDREEVSWVSQNAALFSANPINTVIEDQIEFGRAQSRGGLDYDELMRKSMAGDKKSSSHNRVPSYF